MDRSRHSRCFRMSCTSRHRSRQTPQHKSRLPSRSMCTSMCSSVSSTLVTVWAFRRNCFLIKVSMSTSFGPFVVLGQETTKVNRCGVLLKPRQSTTSSIQRASTAITLLGQEPPRSHRAQECGEPGRPDATKVGYAELSFTSVAFMLFVVVVLALYSLCPVRLRRSFLLIASYAFYCTWSVKAAAAMAGATVLTYFAGKWVGDTQSPHRAKITALFAVCALTGYLVSFKIGASGMFAEPARLAMPLGLSYYTFKLISYVMDAYWGKIEIERRLIPFAAYVAFFPQIVAGPIQRPGDFLSQAPLSRTAVSEGLPRIAWGLAKKVGVADQLAPAVNYVFAHVTALHGVELLAAFYLFPLQLYADFSGLTDIAMGTGRLFGIESPLNSNRPVTAATIAGFWRRWHMSLTSWLADYVFTPLRMATRTAGNAGLALSITLNMVAIGLWHGLTWPYFCFGLLHAGYLVVETEI